MQEYVNPSAEVSHHVMPGDKFFPNNNDLPVLVYKQVFLLTDNDSADTIEKHFNENDWGNSWKEGVFQYHHYHSTAHEVLGVVRGNIMLMLGGDDGNITTLSQGDVIIIPAGVAHKNVGSSEDFLVVGAYPKGLDYDINYGKAEERETADNNIANVPLPDTDPVFGDKGPLLEHWKKDRTMKVLETVSQF
jgi:uncharacterized protein YjlB